MPFAGSRRRWSGVWTVSLFLLLHSAASTYDDLLQAANHPPISSARLSHQEAMEDIKVLARILEDGYAGWEVLNFDWDQAFLSLAREIEVASPLSAERLVDLLVECFSRVEDRHFGFLLREGRRYEWRPANPEKNILFSGLEVVLEREGTVKIVAAPKSHVKLIDRVIFRIESQSPLDFLFETIPDPAGVKRYLVGKPCEDESESLTVEFQSVQGESLVAEIDLHTCNARLKDAHPRPYRLTRIPFPRIELGSFSTLHAEDLDSFVESAQQLRSESLIVIDLRGNAGGSDLFGKQWLKSVTGKDLRGWVIRELVSPVTLQGDVLLHEWLLSNTVDSGAKEQAGGRLVYFKNRLEEGRTNELKRTWATAEELAAPMGPLEIEEAFQGRLLLLVDRGTQSSAETFALLARQVPGTILVGENTGGMARFGEVKLYRLPNSGVWVQAGSKHFEDPTGAFREGWGFAPDYWVDDSNLISSIPRLVERVSLGFGKGAGCGSDFGSGFEGGVASE